METLATAFVILTKYTKQIFVHCMSYVVLGMKPQYFLVQKRNCSMGSFRQIKKKM